MSKRKVHGTAVEDLNRKNKKNKHLNLEDKKDESKPIESIIEPENKKVKTKKNKKSQAIKRNEAKKNKKFNAINDEPDEPVEVKNPTDNRRKTKQAELVQENEEDIKDEDIDKFCDELNKEDNEQYESWVKLIEAQLHSNKKKPN